MLTHCQGHLNTPLDNTSTDTQHVESLYSEQIQFICTRLNCFRIVFIRPLWDFFFLGLQYCSVGTLFNRYMQLSYCASLVSFYKLRTARNDMIYSFFLPVAYSAQWTGAVLFNPCIVGLARVALVLGSNYQSLCLGFQSNTSEPLVGFIIMPLPHFYNYIGPVTLSFVLLSGQT